MSKKPYFSTEKFLDRVKAVMPTFSPSTKLGMSRLLNVTLLIFCVGSLAYLASATAPNPGHNFTEVGGGIVQGDIIYGSAADMFAALPKNTSSTRYLSNTGTSNNPAWAQVDLSNGVVNTLPAGNGGTGQSTYAVGDLLYASGSGTLSKLADVATGNALISGGVGTAPSWGKIDLASHVSGLLSLASGGTNKDLSSGLTAGEILYTDSDSVETTAAGSSGQVLQSAGASAPGWSTATYPATAGTSGNFLKSDGANFVSSAPATISTLVTRGPMATGATLTTQTFSTVLTARKAGLFNVPAQITVNQLTFQATVAGTTPSYTMKVCIYNEAGTSKLIDVTSGTINATSVQSVTVSPAVTLAPGNYYIVYGPATQSGTTPTIALTNFTSTAATWVNTSAVPAGKLKYEGTLTSASGVCDSTMGAITGTVSSTPVVRLDN